MPSQPVYIPNDEPLLNICISRENNRKKKSVNQPASFKISAKVNNWCLKLNIGIAKNAFSNVHHRQPRRFWNMCSFDPNQLLVTDHWKSLLHKPCHQKKNTECLQQVEILFYSKNEKDGIIDVKHVSEYIERSTIQLLVNRHFTFDMVKKWYLFTMSNWLYAAWLLVFLYALIWCYVPQKMSVLSFSVTTMPYGSGLLSLSMLHNLPHAKHLVMQQVVQFKHFVGHSPLYSWSFGSSSLHHIFLSSSSLSFFDGIQGSH